MRPKPFSAVLPNRLDFKADAEGEKLAKELGDRAVARIIEERPLDSLEQIEDLLYGPLPFPEPQEGETVFERKLGRDLRRLEKFEAMTGRSIYTRKFGFAIPFREGVERIIQDERPLLEVSAGSGLWSAILAAEGADIIATDAKLWKWEPCFYPVRRRYARPSIQENRERDVLLIWPEDQGLWARHALRAIWPGRTLYYLGEGPGGNCGSDAFFGTLDRYYEEVDRLPVPQWPAIHDDLSVWRKR